MNSDFSRSVVSVLSSLLLLLFLLLPSVAFSAEIDCLKCHGKLAREKVVHPALSMGCQTCHSAVDTKTVPHKKTNKIAKGLSAEQPELCYGCHDKAIFSHKNVHAAVGMGCTGCHNPHSSKNAKLLISDAPELCFSCHDKAEFGKKNIHAPVAGGMCLSCHTPHSSDETALLLKKPIEVCLECHSDVPKKPHAASGFSATAHPLGMPKAERTSKKSRRAKEKQEQEPKQDEVLMDPARQDKVFYCGSCHNPHSSDSPKLFRYAARSSMELCGNCHKM